MRVLLASLLLVAGLAVVPASADECGDLVGRVTSETGATLQDRSADYARFSAGADTSLTFSCGAPYASSVGAQYRGESPPEAYFTLFGQAGHALTGIEAGMIANAAHRARDAATRLRHSKVDVSGVSVTCSVSKGENGDLTLCAVIEHSDRS